MLFNDTIYHNIAYGNLAASKEQVSGVGGAQAMPLAHKPLIHEPLS